MPADLTLIRNIDGQKRHRRLCRQHADTLMNVLHIQEGSCIASWLDPSNPCSDREAIANWVSGQLLQADKLGTSISIEKLAYQLQDYLLERQESMWV